MNMNATAADNTLKIIGALLVIAVMYCFVEMVRYWRRRNFIKRNMSEGNLFKQPPHNEDCPICFLPLPSMCSGKKYQTCCGKIICGGCVHAVQMMDCNAKCPFCRVPTPESSEENVRRMMKRVEVDDAEAIFNVGCCYADGEQGFPQDYDKALEFFHRAGELGSASAYCNIGNAYYRGEGVERDMTKAKHYQELAAIGGHAIARYNLGIHEENKGNMSMALKHYMIAVGFGDNDSLKAIREFYVNEHATRDDYEKAFILLKHFLIAAGCGDDDSLKMIRKFYRNGHATKDDYAEALQAYQNYVDGIKSDQRDEAAAYNSEHYRYY